ncbi:Ig-like domain-containing protein [uncultured Draconibacterium sp.]|uniref:Ig-like domain-containing protein n=1 Tax=uncultured Draconibacterium sp. TaxID=1573823 RepID=UPI0025E52FF9|nr:Ig-like domain-containing protein [uncultured Draconibacterium sp.]
MESDTIYASICANELPFDWNGTDIFSAGQYLDTIPGEIGVGCDTIRMLDLYIEPMEEDTMYLSLCTNELPYDWNGNPIVSAGQYLDTLPGVVGVSCDTLLVLFVDVHEPDSVYIDTTICEGEPTFAWGVNTIHQVDSYTDNIYTDVLQNQFGCDSIVYLDVEILRPFVITDTIEVCENEPAFAWHSLNILTDRDSIYTDTLYYEAGCDSLRLELTLISHPISDTIIDTTLCEGSPEFAWNTHVVSTFIDSTYLDTMTNMYGCDSTITLNVFISPAIKDTFPLEVCYGEPIEDWYGQTISSTTDSIYEHILPDPSGCDTLFYYEVTINPVTDTVLYYTFCAGPGDTTINSQTITFDQSQIYFDTLYAANQFDCDSTLIYDVTILAPDTTPVYETYCMDETVPDWNGLPIQTQADSIYQATITNEEGCDSVVILYTTIIQGGATFDTVYACVEYEWIEGDGSILTESGDYSNILGTATACPDTTWLHLVISNPKIVADPVNVLCYGDSTGTIDIEVTGGVEPYSYQWSNGETIEDISGLPAGTYFVTVTDALSDTLGCFDTLTVVITEPTPITITEELITPVLVAGESTGSIEVSVSGGTPDYDFAWINVAGDTVGFDEDLFNQPAGEYTLIVTDEYDCQATFTATIIEPVPIDKYMAPLADEICYEDLENYPVANSLSEYLALDTTADVYSLTCGLDTTTFDVDIEKITIGVYCYEEIRTYSIVDLCGDTLSATHVIIVDDQEDPTMSCRSPIVITNDGVPPAYASADEFLADGGIFDDNCGVVSFRQVGSDVTDGGTEPEVITRVYEVADYCGNTFQCTQEIQIYRSAAFSIGCGGLPNISYECREDVPVYQDLDEFRNAGGYAHSDPFEIDSFWVSTSSNGQTCPEEITVTYYIRNENGEIDWCNQKITVDDKTPPEFYLPDKVFYDCDDASEWLRDPRNFYSNGLDVVRYGRFGGEGASISDNCTDMNRAKVYSSGQLAPVGTCPTLIQRVYTAEDDCENETTITENIYIYDNIPPVVNANFPTEISAECDMPEPYTDVSSYVTEDCGPLVIASRDSLGGMEETGVVYRIYTFSDPCNSVEVTQKITIELTNDPKFDDIDPLCQFSVAPLLPTTSLNSTPITGYWLPDTISTDLAGTFDYIFYPDSGYCAGPYSMSIIVIPAIQLDTILVDQGYNPNPVGSIALDISGGSGAYTINWTGPDGYTDSIKDIANLYAGDYRVEVSDNIGCYDSLSVTLLAFEPEFSCPPDTAIECPDVTQYPAATNIDEFIAMGGHYHPGEILADFTSFEEMVSSEHCLTIERTYVIEDIYGRLDSCRQTIDFYDTIPPIIIAPVGDTVECLSSIDSDIETYADFLALGVPVVDDNCAIDPSSFTIRDTIISLQPGRSQLIYYYSIADMCGNIGRDTSYYLIIDDKAPEVFCADITVYLDENGQYHLTIQDSIAMIDSMYDNCTALEDLRVEIEIKEITCEDIESGTQARIIVYDEGGLSAECTANITVVDTLPPEAVCQDITVYLDENGEVTITAEQINNTSTDNCEIASIDISRDRFDCTDVGDNLVQLIVTDIYGYTDTCEANVTVIDEIPPQITCITGDTIQLSEEDGTFLLTWNYITESAWDECGIDTVLLDQYLLDCDDIGQTIITATAYDVNGNSSSCTTEFVIIGNTPPNVVNDSAVTPMDIAVDIPVTNNDFDLKTNIDISTLGVRISPQHGSVVVDNETGIVTYTPDLGYVGPDMFIYQIFDDGIPCEPEPGEAIVFITVIPANEPPVAVDDYFEVPCGELFGNVLYDNGNGADSDPDGDAITVNPVPVTPPDSGALTLFDDGRFEYIPFDGFFGTDSFQYVICDNGIPSLCDTAWVYIKRVPDNDCDGVADAIDIDDDNDGIRDNIENGGYWPEDGMGLVDSDHDGIPDYMDIDSDNDGIPDNIEGQGEHNYIPPTGIDANGDGWDDVYDVSIGGVITFDEELTDTDGDSMPDYLDIDSDNDGVFDMIEGHDADHNGIADVLRWYSDEDHDGLDDAYDTYSGWADYGNEIGSNAPLQDFDDDGTRDWRDTNDEDDEYPTVIEDLNGNGDYSDDDLDLDGYPEYLDTELNCELFIPEGFSPNDDGVHDFFQILCIQKYPNNKLMIFNRNGVKLWEKEHYGILEVWGTYQDAWWWGTSENRLTIGRSGGLPAGNYIYVLILNDGLGTVKNGTVMLAY